MKRLVSAASSAALCRVAALIGLLSLAMIVLPIFVPKPAPVLLGMSVGQGLGALALLLYCAAILKEMRRNAGGNADRDRERTASKADPNG